MSGDVRSGLFAGVVTHRRLRPKKHRLRYRIFCLLLNLDDIPVLCARSRLLSHNRFNIFSFHDRDFGDGSGTSLRAWAEAQLALGGIDLEGGTIRLLAMPRVLGYGFNPISVWFCHHRDGGLRALLHEVHNTFGERHVYLIPTAEDQTESDIRQSCAKTFHVSPFMAMKMRYEFRIHAPDERMSLAIRGDDADGPMIVAAFAARRQDLTDWTLARAFFMTPLLTLKVIAGIHWEALRLFAKGLRIHRHPAPPERLVDIVKPPINPPTLTA